MHHRGGLQELKLVEDIRAVFRVACVSNVVAKMQQSPEKLRSGDYLIACGLIDPTREVWRG